MKALKIRLLQRNLEHANWNLNRNISLGFVDKSIASKEIEKNTRNINRLKQLR